MSSMNAFLVASFLAAPMLGGAFEFASGLDALFLQRGDAAAINRLGNQGDGNAQILRINNRPFPGALLSGGVQDPFDQRLAIAIPEGENIAGNLDQIAFQIALIPSLKT
jgi:hypothetical protein